MAVQRASGADRASVMSGRAVLGDHPSLQHVVYQWIKEAILSGRLDPGSRIVEQTLSKELGVSRSPLREALRRLEQEGLVRASPRHGVSVTAPSEREVDEIYAVRTALEALAARLAAPRFDAKVAARLGEVLDRQARSIGRGDLEGAARADALFHEAILRSTENTRLVGIATELADFVRRVRLAVLAQPGRAAAVIREHRQILDALAAHDAARAERHMTDHISRAHDTMLGLLQRGGERDGGAGARRGAARKGARRSR